MTTRSFRRQRRRDRKSLLKRLAVLAIALIVLVLLALFTFSRDDISTLMIVGGGAAAFVAVICLIDIVVALCRLFALRPGAPAKEA